MKYADQTSEIRRTWPEETTRSCLNVRVNETSEHTKKNVKLMRRRWCMMCSTFRNITEESQGGSRSFSTWLKLENESFAATKKPRCFIWIRWVTFVPPPPPCGNVSVMPLPKTSYITFPSDPFVKFHSSLRWSAGPESALVSTLVVNRGERAALFLAEPRPGPKQKLSKRT